MTHLWSGRFDGAPDEEVFAFQASFAFDRRLFDDDVTGSLAWAEALAGAGVLSAGDAAAIRDALIEIRDRGRGDPAFVDGPDEDVHAFVERKLIERVGDAGKRLHTGRSRNEQVALDLRLYLRRRITAVQHEVVALVDALAGRAESAGRALMPSYTHLRRAQPILVAHYFLAHAAALRRAHRRFEVARDEADALTLGSGAIAGSSYDVDTAALARRLGFSRVVANSLDATADRDFVSGFLHACAGTMVHLSRLAEDLVILTSEEFGFLGLSDAVTTGSSLMPQKKNPDPSSWCGARRAGSSAGSPAGSPRRRGWPAATTRTCRRTRRRSSTPRTPCSARFAPPPPSSAPSRSTRPGPARRPRGSRSRPTSPTCWWPGESRSARRTRWWGASSATSWRGARLRVADPREWRRYHERLDAESAARITARGSVEARRTPQSTGPEAVAAALGETRRWIDATEG